MVELLLPLFPLEIVLLPWQRLPLHIFEERYKQMVAACLDARDRGSGEEEFGIVLAKQQNVRNVGCTAKIVKIVHRYDDGRLDILTVGRRRFGVLCTNQDKPYLRAGVEFFDDLEGDAAPSTELSKRALQLFREIIAHLKDAPELPDGFPRPEQSLSFQLAAPLSLELDFKQKLLENRSESERLVLLTGNLERLMRQFEAVEKARAKAGGNGKLRSR